MKFLQTILVVEDNPNYVADTELIYFALPERRHLTQTVRYAHDLQQFQEAMKELLEEGEEFGVITDMCFHEKGVSVESWIAESYFKDECNPTAQKTLREVMEKSKKTKGSYLGETSEELRQEVIKASLEFQDAPTGREKYTVGRDEIVSRNNSERSNPALGYFVIKECQKQNIPVVFITSLGHGNYIPPAIMATGLLEIEEFRSIIKYNNDDKDWDMSLCNREIVMKNGVFKGEKDGFAWITALKILLRA